MRHQRGTNKHAAAQRSRLHSEVRQRSPRKRVGQSGGRDGRLAPDVPEDIALSLTVCDKRPRGWACEIAFAPDYAQQPNAVVAPAASIGVIRLMVANELAREFVQGDSYRVIFWRDLACGHGRPAYGAGCGEHRV